jgi:hypothetical protein
LVVAALRPQPRLRTHPRRGQRQLRRLEETGGLAAVVVAALRPHPRL